MATVNRRFQTAESIQKYLKIKQTKKAIGK